jgi:hypothetical protein
VSLPGIVSALKARAFGLDCVAALVLGGLLGLLPYAYVPLVASRNDALVWGAPVSFDALFDYLSGRDFRANLSVSASVWLRQMLSWVAFSLEFTLLPLWGIGLVAHALTPARGLTRALAPMLCVLAVAYLARYARFLPEIPDYVSYVSLATWVCLVGCAALLTWLWSRRSYAGAAALLVVIAASVFSASPALHVRTRFRDRTARVIASSLLASAPPKAVLVLGSDHWVAPLWYLQEIEAARPDVVILASGLLSSSWYFDHVHRRHPDFVRATLRGPGGQLGRLARLLAQNAERPVLFEDPALAHALGFSYCVHRFLAAARTACNSQPEERVQAAALWERLRANVGEGEPTSLGVLASISYQRGMLLASVGDLPAALRTLLVPVAGATADLGPAASATLAQPPPRPPVWRRDVPLGEPARNLYMAAQLLMAAGAPKQALIRMLAARELGLPEAEAWLASMLSAPP